KSSEEIKKLIKIANKEERKFNLSSRVAELNAQERDKKILERRQKANNNNVTHNS
ncbi:unnamed protein product, partial [Rotaria magnacalcarata]